MSDEAMNLRKEGSLEDATIEALLNVGDLEVKLDALYMSPAIFTSVADIEHASKSLREAEAKRDSFYQAAREN